METKYIHIQKITWISKSTAGEAMAYTRRLKTQTPALDNIHGNNTIAYEYRIAHSFTAPEIIDNDVDMMALPISVQRFRFHLVANRKSATLRGYRINTQ